MFKFCVKWFKIYIIYLFIVCGEGHVLAAMHTWKSGHNLWKLVLSFHMWGSNADLQAWWQRAFTGWAFLPALSSDFSFSEDQDNPDYNISSQTKTIKEQPSSMMSLLRILQGKSTGGWDGAVLVGASGSSSVGLKGRSQRSGLPWGLGVILSGLSFGIVFRGA